MQQPVFSFAASRTRQQTFNVQKDHRSSIRRGHTHRQRHLPQAGIDLAEQMPAAQLRQNILPPPVILAQDMHAAGNDKTSCRYLLAQLPDKAVPRIDPQLRIQILQHCRDLCFRNTAEQRCRRYDLQIFIHSSLPPL